MVFIIGRALSADQAVAAVKHVMASASRLPIETKYGLQRTAVGKHIVHIDHISCIEIAQIKASQAAAVIEHLAHVNHIVGVKTAQVKASQPRAQFEHGTHGFHLGRIEIAQVKARQA